MWLFWAKSFINIRSERQENIYNNNNTKHVMTLLTSTAKYNVLTSIYGKLTCTLL